MTGWQRPLCQRGRGHPLSPQMPETAFGSEAIGVLTTVEAEAEVEVEVEVEAEAEAEAEAGAEAGAEAEASGVGAATFSDLPDLGFGRPGAETRRELAKARGPR